MGVIKLSRALIYSHKCAINSVLCYKIKRKWPFRKWKEEKFWRSWEENNYSGIGVERYTAKGCCNNSLLDNLFTIIFTRSAIRWL